MAAPAPLMPNSMIHGQKFRLRISMIHHLCVYAVWLLVSLHDCSSLMVNSDANSIIHCQKVSFFFEATGGVLPPTDYIYIKKRGNKCQRSTLRNKKRKKENKPDYKRLSIH
jgi:hypothetical protein